MPSIPMLLWSRYRLWLARKRVAFLTGPSRIGAADEALETPVRDLITAPHARRHHPHDSYHKNPERHPAWPVDFPK
jgi:hypothetical protein